MIPLTFEQLRVANQRRLPDFWKFYGDESGDGIDGWSPAEWTNALAGEVGEFCNLTKKVLRQQHIPIEELMKEAADAGIYLDLCCQRLGFRLEDALRLKFNERSRDIGSEVML